jgi:hypothetical protein
MLVSAKRHILGDLLETRNADLLGLQSPRDLIPGHSEGPSCVVLENKGRFFAQWTGWLRRVIETLCGWPDGLANGGFRVSSKILW